ncbi:MAG: DnaJ family molecular chaperone [Candidatus Tectimicrobiota bacterium]
MASLLQRLVDLGRSQFNHLFGARASGASAQTTWEPEFEAQEETTYTEPPFEAQDAPGQGLPYSDELARCYRLLDLPYGVPLEQVARQWKAYLRRCHPDRHANDPAKQADATFLTQQLNDAYRKIKQAWERRQR